MSATGCPIKLCRLDELADPDSRAFDLSASGLLLEVFVVHQQGQVYGYVNSCPHTRASLEWLPDQFLSLDKRYIQCSNHDAKFRIRDGFCISGPCAGKSLMPVPIRVEEGDVWLLPFVG